jgi:hypothetical protein
MTGKVRTDESRNEIRKSPGAPIAPAYATIFCFQPFRNSSVNQVHKCIRRFSH